MGTNRNMKIKTFLTFPMVRRLLYSMILLSICSNFYKQLRFGIDGIVSSSKEWILEETIMTANSGDASSSNTNSATTKVPSSSFEIQHSVLTRFMIGQADQKHLARAHFNLFKAFCLPTMIHQSSQNFFWIVLMDPGLDQTEIDEMANLLSTHNFPSQNAYLVLTNNTFWATDGINPKSNPNATSYGVGLHTVARAMRESTVQVRTGDTSKLLQTLSTSPHQSNSTTQVSTSTSSHLLRHPHSVSSSLILVETLLDADDGLHHKVIETMQRTIVQRVSSHDFLTPLTLESTWTVLCGSDHLEWHNRDILKMPLQDFVKQGISDGIVGRRETARECISAGYTRFGVTKNDGKDDKFPRAALLNHSSATEQLNMCQMPNSTHCYFRIFQDFLFAIRSRTITSDSMTHLDPDIESYDRRSPFVKDTKFHIDQENVYWKLLQDSFFVDRNQVHNVSMLLYTERAAILPENESGRCIPGFPCVNHTEKKLHKLKGMLVAEDVSNGHSLFSAENNVSSYFTLGLVRAIGNALPPRHDAAQTLRNLEFILRYEPDFPKVHKHWILNRIIDPDLLQLLLELLQKYNQTSYTIIPFVLQDYAKLHYHLREWDAIQNDKNLYVTNQNNARNFALDFYASVHDVANASSDQRVDSSNPPLVDYVLPWDGNCFLTQSAYQLLQRDLINWHSPSNRPKNNASTTTAANISSTNDDVVPIKYFYTPMDRLWRPNSVLLDPNYKPNAKEEPQLVFHRTANARFDPTLRYGEKNKVKLLWILRIPGAWNKYYESSGHDPPPFVDDWQGFAPLPVGWVSRLFSGQPQLEKQDASPRRSKARKNAMTRILQKLDLRAVQEIHHWNATRTWMYFDRDTLTMEANAWKAEQLEQNNPNNTSASSLIRTLLNLADTALFKGPWSVADKEVCGCGVTKDCHDYYNVIGFKSQTQQDKYMIAPSNNVNCTLDEHRYDRIRLQHFQYNTTILALAYTITGQKRYAQKAAKNLVTWFVQDDTRMNPRLSVVWRNSKGRNDKYPNELGTMDFKDVYFFLDAVRMIEESGALDDDEQASLKRWFREYLLWLIKSQRKTRFESDHHELYHVLQVASIASYTGDASLTLQTLHGSSFRLLTHVSESGKLIRDTTNAHCEKAQMLTLHGWASLARLARKVGITLWTLKKSTTDKSKSILCVAAEASIPLLQRVPSCPTSRPAMTDDDHPSKWFPLYLETQAHCPNVGVKYPFFNWPTWWPPYNRSGILPIDSLYEMTPVFPTDFGIAPFWNLGRPVDEFSHELDTGSADIPVASKNISNVSPVRIHASSIRNLSTQSGYYKG